LFSILKIKILTLTQTQNIPKNNIPIYLKSKHFFKHFLFFFKKKHISKQSHWVIQKIFFKIWFLNNISQFHVICYFKNCITISRNCDTLICELNFKKSKTSPKAMSHYRIQRTRVRIQQFQFQPKYNLNGKEIYIYKI